MLRACDTDRPCLNLVYEMWDSTIENVKATIYRHEGKRLTKSSIFYEVVYDKLIDCWTKIVHHCCLAYSLNPR